MTLLMVFSADSVVYWWQVKPSVFSTEISDLLPSAIDQEQCLGRAVQRCCPHRSKTLNWQ